MAEKRLFPVIRDKAPIVDFIRGKSNANQLPDTQNDLVQSFREGLAEGLGIPVEAISQEDMKNWLVQYIKAFISPEHMDKIAPSLSEIKALGVSLGTLIRGSFEVPVNDDKLIQPKKTSLIGPKGEKKTERGHSLRASVVGSKE